MKKNFTYCLMALLIFISFATPANAQVNGTAAKPLVSNAEKPVYYYIESASNGTVKMGANNGLNLLGNLIYVPTTTSGVRLKHDLLANITGTTINLNADVALWQILNEGGLLKLKNKATGMYMDASDKAVTTTTYSFLATVYNTTPTQYYIKNSNTNPSNAWTLNNLDKWGYFTPSENSQIAWYFIVAPGSEANYADALNAQIKTDFDAKVLQAQSLLAVTIEGADFGQYNAESRTTLSAAIADAVAVQGDDNKTNEEIVTATNTLNTAIATYKSAVNSSPVSLISASGSNYRWYWIKSTSAHAYAQNKVISAGTRILGEKFTFEPKAAEVSDVQLFRFELTEDQTKVLNIINKAGGYMANNGAIATTSTADNNFALNLLADGYSFNIKPTSLNAIHAQETGAHIVNWPGDAGTSSAWVFEYALETPRITTALNNSEMSEYKIKVSDRIISVEGESEFEIYSVTGQKLDKQFRLATGVYFVKLNNATVKVIVR